MHKDVFPVLPLEIWGLIIFVGIKALSNVAGIGGGGVAVPIVMVFFAFRTKPAIALSSFSILLSTTATFSFNFNESHPDKPNVNVIDYGLTSIMMPTTLAGAQLGSLILIAFPSLWI